MDPYLSVLSFFHTFHVIICYAYGHKHLLILRCFHLGGSAWNGLSAQARSQGGGSAWGQTPPPWAKGSIGYSTKVHIFTKWDPPFRLKVHFSPNKTPPWEILATGLRRGMNAYMCGGKHGRQSHATSRIRLTHVHRTVLDGHVLGASGTSRIRDVWLHVMCISLHVHFMSCWFHFMSISLHVDFMSCWFHFMYISCHVDFTSCRFHVMYISLHVHFMSCRFHVMSISSHVDFTSCTFHVMSISLHVDFKSCRFYVMYDVHFMSCQFHFMSISLHVDFMSCWYISRHGSSLIHHTWLQLPPFILDTRLARRCRPPRLTHIAYQPYLNWRAGVA